MEPWRFLQELLAGVFRRFLLYTSFCAQTTPRFIRRDARWKKQSAQGWLPWRSHVPCWTDGSGYM